MYVPRLLSAGEWFHDSATDTLYLWRNASQEAQLGSTARFVGTLGEGVLRIVGSSATQPAVGITVSNLRIRHTTTDVLAPYEAPGGGDQSAHRGGAVFIENASAVAVTGCHFERVDGSGVFVSRWARDVRIASSEFSFTGSAGVVVMGACELIDCTAGTQPHRTIIEGCFLHDGGVFSKNYLGGSIFLALQAEATVRGNVIFNTPRSCMTINDGALGGDEVSGNLMLNCNRETSDTGVIYTYNRLPFLSTTRLGAGEPPSLIMKSRRIHNNLLACNYGSGGGVDNGALASTHAPPVLALLCCSDCGCCCGGRWAFLPLYPSGAGQQPHPCLVSPPLPCLPEMASADDGSSFYNETANVLYNCEVKHSTFTTGGHAKSTSNTLIVSDRGCDVGQGFYERFDNNTCCMFAASGAWLNVPTSAACNPAQPRSFPGRPVPTPQRQGNTYYLANASAWRYRCGGAEWTLAQAQARGLELGSVLRPLPHDEAQVAEMIMGLARPLLGIADTQQRTSHVAQA